MTIILDGTNGLSDVDGTAATPAIRGTDTNTGIFFPAADTIAFSEGGAEAMRIDSSGNVGIGTSSPSAKLHVVTGTDNANALNIQGDTTNNVMTLTNYQMLVGRESGSNGGLTIGTKSQTWGASGAFTAIATNGTERMRIDSSGNLLVGTTAKVYDGKISVSFASTGQQGISLIDTTATTGGIYAYFINNSGNVAGSISRNGTTTVAYTTSSDYRLKENIAPMQGALDVVQALKPVTYNWKADGSSGQGFIAHELQAVAPDCVTGEKDATRIEQYEITPAIPATFDEEGNELTPAVEAVMGEREVPVYQGIDTSFLVATLTAAIQELKAELDATKAEVAALKGAVA